MNYKRKSRRRFFLLMRSRTPPISSEFRGEGGLNPPNHPLGTPLILPTNQKQTSHFFPPKFLDFATRYSWINASFASWILIYAPFSDTWVFVINTDESRYIDMFTSAIPSQLLWIFYRFWRLFWVTSPFSQIVPNLASCLCKSLSFFSTI